ncbi:major facilitator superfamily MFS_1 [Syntrophobotulus glycolicus DSM 8271]|uniref:Major facilitator superfamily MFS_1 n=1 Tax=Syntrophobotulus glycolicus (strain DSM 8271 / FlGlyR) TaxID=645991 RepID=F0SU67_SYNGF|nr:MFS transporter [Syntrophobotulus glycolicus]ADY55450.1 major facilitator superfamily MFS_1 [Syntrophobotulus glycolicus DSM 8271]
MKKKNSNQNRPPAASKQTWHLLFIAIFIALVVDGMDLQLLSLCLPAIRADFAVSPIKAGALTSYTLIGMGIGGLIAGLLSDRIGRVKTTIASLLTFTVFTFLLGFVQTYWQFALVRFFSGFGISALYSIGTLLVAEYVPTKKRGTVMGFLIAGWSVGYILAALISAAVLPVYGWRPLFVLSVFPALISFFILRKTQEPAGFLAAAAQKDSRTKQNEYVVIWKDKAVRKVFLLWGITYTALQFGYYGANTWLPSYLNTELGLNFKEMSLYVAGTYTAMVFGKLLAGFLADKLGRRVMWLIVGLSTAVSMPLLVTSISLTNAIFLMVGFGFLYATPLALLPAYMSETFPVRIRGTAMASLASVGKIGSVLSPLFIGYMATEFSIGYGIGLLGIAYTICGLVPGLLIKEKTFDPCAADSAGSLGNLSVIEQENS